MAHGALDSIDDSVRSIIDAPEFQRLRGLSQLSLAKHVFPGACHTRFEHSLSAFRFSLAYLRSLLGPSNDHAFRQEVTEADVVCCALTALLHDIGHTPFSHYLGGAPNAPSQREGAMHLLTSPTSALRERVEQVLRKMAVPIDSFLRFFECSFDPTPRVDLPHWYALARVINGPIDVDKLSYLTLDGLHTGLPYAASLDPEGLARNLRAVRVDGHFDLALADAARLPAEILAVARYAMYDAVYWHRTVRAFSTMVRRAFDMALGGVDRKMVLERAIQLGDDAFLQWLKDELARRAPEALWLIDDILARRPLSRVLSLRRAAKGASAEEAIESRFYDEVITASAGSSESAIARIEATFRKALLRVPGINTQPDVVLVDFPGMKQADAGDIYLIHGPSGALISPGPLWVAIQQNFRVWVAKARIFVKPSLELSSTQRQVLVREMLAELERGHQGAGVTTPLAAASP